MASHKTEYLELHKWERTDPFKMDEFNENFDKLDKAAGPGAGGLRVFVDHYTGVGKYGINNPNSITLPFTPKLLIIFTNCNPSYFGETYDGKSLLQPYLIWGVTKQFSYVLGSTGSERSNTVTYDDETHTVKWYSNSGYESAQLNINGWDYYYMAIG